MPNTPSINPFALQGLLEPPRAHHVWASHFRSHNPVPRPIASSCLLAPDRVVLPATPVKPEMLRSGNILYEYAEGKSGEEVLYCYPQTADPR